MKILLTSIISLFLISCASNTVNKIQILDSWANSSMKSKRIKKVAVYADTKDLFHKRNFEFILADQLRQNGVTATEGIKYKHPDSDTKYTVEEITKTLKNDSVEGVVTLRLIAVNDSLEYIAAKHQAVGIGVSAPMTYTNESDYYKYTGAMTPHYGSWGSYYGNHIARGYGYSGGYVGKVTEVAPARVDTLKTFRLSCNLYGLGTDSLIWASEIEIGSPSSSTGAAEAVSKAVVEKIMALGIFVKSAKKEESK